MSLGECSSLFAKLPQGKQHSIDVSTINSKLL